MAKGTNQKLKLGYLIKILLERTDDTHSLTMPEIIEALAAYDISAERKSIYADLETIRDLGIDIIGEQKGKTFYYHVAGRQFELAELKLLVDSVQASKFITHKKSLELISKIEKLTSHENAKLLRRQVYVTNRVKTPNEKIYNNVDKIHEAIAENKKITFRYFSLDVDKKKVYRKNGERYTESPVALTWDDENYYLITYKEKYDNYTHYRVDKMEGIEKTEAERVLAAAPFDLSSYTKTMFSMYGGEETDVSIEFTNDLVGVLFDRFGTDIPILKKDAEHFTCRVRVAVSPHFLSWIMSFGKKVLMKNYKIL